MKRILLTVIILLAVLHQSEQLNLQQFLTLNYDEKIKLDEFKNLVIPNLPHQWMNQEAYLIMWLRDSDFDISSAETKLMNNIKWRRDNKMDTILEEDWIKYDEEFRVFIEGCDKDGKPIISVFVGDWDIRRQVITGKSAKMMRFFDKLFEEAVVTVRNMVESGQNVTQATMIFDMSNFNLIQQGCPRCIPIYLHVLNTMEQHYPGTLHKLLAVNTPQIAIPLWELFKSLLSKQSLDVLSIYGKDKKEWQRVLAEDVDKDQLSKPFGGINEEPLDYTGLRENGRNYKCSNKI